MDNKEDNNVIEIFDSDSDENIGSDQNNICEEAGGSGKRKWAVRDISDDELYSDGENDIEWIEESSESEPEYDCDIWDNDCITISQQRRKNAVYGYHVMPTCPTEETACAVKQFKLSENPSLNDKLTEEQFVSTLKQNWQANTNITMKSVEFITDPFKVCIVDDFIQYTDILDKIRNEMYELNWNKRNMDLYEFFQSKDLINLENKFLKNMYEFLRNDIMEWMQQITGLELNKTSATCSVYTDTDYLHVHDDLQEDRSVAFILYLTDPLPGSSKELWNNEMGGALELFNKDEKGHPGEPVKQILPKNNRFVFFKVTNDSYHKVTEVLNMDHCRMSINGWFHTPTPEIYKTPSFDVPTKGLFSSDRLPPLTIESCLTSWISPHYLRKNVMKQIQSHIETESEISLNEFFKKEKYQDLCDTLENNDIIWDKVGPANRRNYEVMSDKAMPNIVKEMLILFQSKDMFSLLEDYTDLDLNVDTKKNITPTVRLELQRWKSGSYSLLSEYDWEKENELDKRLERLHTF
ncbi:sudestada1 [Carabus blaptoides fortunei]